MTQGGSRDGMASTTLVRLLAFNILQMPLGAGSWRRAALAERAIMQAAADVVVLNEAFSRPAGALVARLGTRGYHTTSHLGRVGGSWDGRSGRTGTVSRLVGGGVYVLSRYPIVARHEHVYRALRATTTDALSNKGVALVSLALPSGPLWVAATHLQADEHGDGHAVRLAQLGELRALVAATVPAGDPVVIAGDLNVEYAGKAGAALADAARAVDGHLAPHGPIHAPTFDAATNAIAARDSPGYSHVLDYVGVLHGEGRPPLRITTETRRFDEDGDASDHFPVLATIAVPGEGVLPRPAPASGSACAPPP